jgi:hypothetical protein
MTKQRSSHDAKTLEDRRQYQATTIRKVPTPTVEEPQYVGESTEDMRPSDTQSTSPYSPTARSHESALGKFFKERWPELLVTLLLAGGAAQTCSLNREVGELRVRVESATNDQQKVEHDVDKVEDRLQKQIDRLATAVESKATTPTVVPAPIPATAPAAPSPTNPKRH